MTATMVAIRTARASTTTSPQGLAALLNRFQRDRRCRLVIGLLRTKVNIP